MQNVPVLIGLGVVLYGNSAIGAVLTGTILDKATMRPIAARVYVENASGEFFHVNCDVGSAVRYDKRRSDTSFEVHTTVSADPFHVDLPAGEYKITVEKGKEYFTATRNVRVTDDPSTKIAIQIPLRRWTNMAAKGWYSGETHVHREVSELPTLQLAEDVNVAFPLTAWVTDSEHSPATHNKNLRDVPAAGLVRIDDTHVFWPVNTEYEIFTIRGQDHTLGAVFILNHKTQLAMSAPPVVPIAAEARQQGAFLELDKHNWPWSIMLVPKMSVELFELANNHMWRTEFLYSDWYPEYAGKYMNVETINGEFTERGWIDFGFETYYALLNCGFNMKPTAGTASGVHPVPFGFSRVYVKLEEGFGYEEWNEGLLSGRSFVTTGPMLTHAVEQIDAQTIRVNGHLESPTAPISIEVVANGRVVKKIDAQGQSDSLGAFKIPFDVDLNLEGTTWVAVRAFAKRDANRISFAHSAPSYIKVAERPLKPTRSQRNYLAKRVQDEIDRSRGVISGASLKEFEDALQHFESMPVAD